MRNTALKPVMPYHGSSRPPKSRNWIPKAGTFPYLPAVTACLGMLALFGLGPNFGLAVFSLVALLLGSWICWRPGEPAIILYIFLFQWIQAAIGIFSANIKGMSIVDTAQLSMSSMDQATFLTLIGLLTIFVAFRLTAGRSSAAVVRRAAEEAQLLKVTHLVVVYVFSIIAAIILSYFATISAGLQQPILALLSFKEAVFFIVIYVGFRRGGHFRTLFYCAFAFEFISSLGGYFSTFQTVFIYTFIAMLAAGVRLRAGHFIGGSVLAAASIFVGVVWSAIKVDYREYLNGGTGQQVVTVGTADSLQTLADMALSIDSRELSDGADRLVRRLTYVEFFGAAMNHVPLVIDHTDGKLWGDALIHPFTPRLFFPNKPIIDSSAQTNLYTGVRVAGREQGAQISIGYMGESYIDFGTWGMFIPLALYGVAAGFLYRKILYLRKFIGLLSMGLCVPLLMGGSYLNAETIKMVGHLIVTSLAIFAVHIAAGDKIRTLVLGGGRSQQFYMPRTDTGDVCEHIGSSRSPRS